MSMTEDGFDLQAFARRAQAVREFQHRRDADGVVFQCRYPSRFERLAIDTRHGEDAAKVRAVVLASVTGWSGVQVKHALPDAKNPSDVLPFGPDTLALLFDEQTVWMIDLWTDIKNRIAARDKAIEESLKNSESASATSDDAPAPVN